MGAEGELPLGSFDDPFCRAWMDRMEGYCQSACCGERLDQSTSWRRRCATAESRGECGHEGTRRRRYQAMALHGPRIGDRTACGKQARRMAAAWQPSEQRLPAILGRRHRRRTGRPQRRAAPGLPPLPCRRPCCCFTYHWLPATASGLGRPPGSCPLSAGALGRCAWRLASACLWQRCRALRGLPGRLQAAVE